MPDPEGPPQNEQSPAQHQPEPTSDESHEHIAETALGEQAISASGGEMAVEGSEQQEIVAASSEGKRWDEDKARTVGMAAKESDKMDSSFRRQITGVLDRDDFPYDHRAFDNEELTGARVRINHYDLIQDLNNAEYQIRNLEEKGQEVPEELRAKLRLAQEAYDAVVPESRNVTSEFIEQAVRAREGVIEKLTYSFEELYEMNPELFAKMPTAEFIEARKELLGIEHDINNSSEGLENITTILDKLQKMIDEKRKIKFGGAGYYYTGPDVDSRTIITTVGVALGSLDKDTPGVEKIPQNDGLYEYDRTFDATPDYPDDIDLYDIRHKYIEEVHGDEFEKTPRQIMEDYKKITTEYLEQVRTKLEEAERRKQEFMAKYAKGGNNNPEPSANKQTAA